MSVRGGKKESMVKNNCNNVTEKQQRKTNATHGTMVT